MELPRLSRLDDDPNRCECQAQFHCFPAAGALMVEAEASACEDPIVAVVDELVPQVRARTGSSGQLKFNLATLLRA